MKILIIVDKKGSAIDRLARAVQRNSPHQDIVIFPIHPKGNDVDVMIEVQKLMVWCDILDIHYWKSGQVLRNAFPNEFEAKPKVLFHMNPYDAESEENQYYNKVVVGNSEIHSRVPYATLIPYGIDLSFFKFQDEYTEDKVVNMSVARIEGKKGVLEVAKACQELGYKFKLVGRVSKADYMQEVLKAGGDCIEFFEDVKDEKLREIYYQSAIHVCNSTDNFESGTLPILECMACGVPVLTRIVGHVPELYDGSNMVIRQNGPEDVEDIKKNLKEMMENRDWRIKLREKAWETIRNRDDRRMSLQINKLYYSLYKPEHPLVSVIIPTKDNPECLVECLMGALKQEYEKTEVIVCDSGNTPIEEIIRSARKYSNFPIKYIHFIHKDSYTLAEARNRGIVEAEGEYIVFCDDRMKMEKGAVAAFVAYARPDAWLWGVKDDCIKSFVENFSFVARINLIKHGLLCERMQWYGGMTQEIRERYEKLGGVFFILVDEAKAYEIKRSKSKRHRRSDIIEAKFLDYKLYSK